MSPTYAVKMERVFRAEDEHDAAIQMAESLVTHHNGPDDFEIEEIEDDEVPSR